MSDSHQEHVGGRPWTPIREKWLLITLAAIQFTTVLDFLIIMPLGPQYMRVFHINPPEFGIIVSSYVFSAGIAGVLASLFIDRFDRRTALLWLYFGFGISTLLCALAPSYRLLVAARLIAGAFGGVTGSLILAIIGDMIPEVRRGAAMGLVMSSWSIASVCGVPIGLVLAADFSWHVPFYALAGLCLLVLIAVGMALPSLQRHRKHAHDRRPWEFMKEVISRPAHQKSFLFMAGLTFMGFCVFPYISPFMVSNVGMTEKQLLYVYGVGGLFTVFSMNWVGRWSDRIGKLPVFRISALSTILPILALTNLPRVPLWGAVAVTTAFMICMSSRMVPAMAMMTSVVEPRYRGSFMSINSSVQQLSAGLAAYLIGKILGVAPDGKMTHYPYAGFVALAFVGICLYIANTLPRPVSKSDTSDHLSGEQSHLITE